MAKPGMTESVRSRCYQALVNTGVHVPERLVVSALIVATIAVSVAATMVRTLPELDPEVAAVAAALGFAVNLLFTLEYVVRLWAAPEADPALAPSRARLAYARSFLGLVDLGVVLPVWLGQFGMLGLEWAMIAGLLPLLKLTRHAPGLGLLATVIRSEARVLSAAFMVMVVVLVIASGVMYVLEHESQPSVFRSVPHSLWWGIVTVATVGYGDIVPITAGGKVFAGMTMLIGIALFAVPAGILATGFAAEIRKRDFIVTWQSVGRVPLFAGLDAGRIAEIARLLKPEVVPSGAVIVRRGELAEAMFFIMDGEVEVEVEPAPVRLGAGQFFGEMALLQDGRRTATVRALADCRLLALGVRDFRRLVEANPDLAAQLDKVAESRRKPTPA